MLLAFVDERGDNGALLRLLAACRAEIDAACWGVFLLQPHERAGCRLPDSVLPGARTNASPSPNPSPSPNRNLGFVRCPNPSPSPNPNPTRAEPEPSALCLSPGESGVIARYRGQT